MRKLSKILALVLVLMMAFAVVSAFSFTSSAATPEKLYLTPSANWKQSNARFAAYFFGNGEKWVSMTYNSSLGVYEVSVPAGYPNVIFCRMNPSASANNWNNKWNQTADLVIPTSGANHYTVKEGTWDKGGGTWSTLGSSCKHANLSSAATCTEAQICLDCKDPIVSALGHTYNSAHLCTRCNGQATFTVAGSGAHLGTEWDTGNVANDMTFADGVYTKVYTNVAAGSYLLKVARDHDWGTAYPGSDKAYTVATAGSTVTVTLKGTTVTVTVEAPHVHSWSDATCTEAQKCSCGETQGEALGHNMVAGEVVAPTYESQGYTVYTCANGCGTTENRDYVDALVSAITGSGTEEDPYLITTLEGLVEFRDSVNAGETKYNAEGVYVALGADIDMSSVDWSVNIGDDCNATFDGIFDGKNHKLSNLNAKETAKKADGYVCGGLFGAIYGNAVIKNLVIENVSIDAGEFTGNNVAAVVGFVYAGKGSIENVTVCGKIEINAPGVYGVGAIVGYSYYGSNLTVKDCKVVGNEGSYINAVSGAGAIAGYAYGIHVVNAEVSGLTIEGAGLLGGLVGIAVNNSTDVNGAHVANVTLNATKDVWVNGTGIAVGTLSSNSIKIEGVTFENVTGADTLLGSAYAEKPETVVPAFVAKVGDIYYTDIQEALNVGGEVVLLTNVELDAALTVNGTVVIDLAGFTLSYESDVMGEAMITNKGNLTINDSVGTGVINYNYVGANDASYGKGNYTISNAGTLTVNGGKITIANLRSHAKYPIDNNSTTGDAILVINGGHLYNYNTSAIRMFCNSTTNKNSVTINGGVVEGYCAVWVQNPGNKTVNADLTITGGEIRTTAAAWVNGTANLNEVSSALYFTIAANGGAWSEASFVAITGGTFNENVYLADSAPANISIGEGATFNGYVELPHTHSWSDATCTEPSKCSCGETQGEALGHTWADATCEAAKTCSVCGATDGEALGHTPGAAATCIAAQTCTVCGAELVAKLGHVDANLDVECDREGCTSKVAPPADSVLSNFTANNLGSKLSTSNKYYVIGTIVEVLDQKNGIFLVDDGTGEKFYFRLPKNADGVSHASWEIKLTLGDKVQVYGAINKYSTSTAPNGQYWPAMQSPVVTILEQHAHVPNGAIVCTKDTLCACGTLVAPATGHIDADENGICDNCPWDMNLVEVNIAIGTDPKYNGVRVDDEAGKALSWTWSAGGFDAIISKGTSTVTLYTTAKDYMQLKKQNLLTIVNTEDVTVKYITISVTNATYLTHLKTALTNSGYEYTADETNFTATIQLNSAEDFVLENKASSTIYVNGVSIVYAKKGAHVHEFTGTVTTPATCLEAGVKTFTCTCGEATYTEVIEALGHDFVEGVCSRCNYEDPNYVPPCAHKDAGLDAKCDVCGEYFLPTSPFKLEMYQATKKETYYFTGAMSGYYFATSTDITKAVDLYAEEVEGGYNVYFMSGSTKNYLYIEMSGTHINAKFGSTKAVWYVDAKYGALVTEIDGEKYFLGTYSNYVTFGGTAYSRLNDSTADVSQYIGRAVSLEDHVCEGTTTVTDPTCTTQGYTTLTCDVCGRATKSNYVDALGHTYENCACTVCGAVLPTLGQTDAFDFTTADGLNAALASGKLGYTGTFRNNGDSHQFAADSSIQFVVPANTTVTLTGHSTGYGVFTVYVNGVKHDMAGSLTFTVTEESKVVIVPDETATYSKAYLKGISLAEYVDRTITSDTTINFGSEGNYKDSLVDFSGIQIGDNGGNNSQVKNGSFDLLLKAGSKVVIHGYPGYTSYKLNDGEEITSEYYTYLALEDTVLTVTPVNGNNYFYSIEVTLHTGVALVEAVDSTCKVAGHEAYYSCECHGELTEKVARELAAHTEEVLAAVAPTCTTTGLTEGKKCSACGEVLVAQEEVAALGHTEEVLAAVAPTCTATGLTEGKKCSVCGEVLVAQEEVAALGHTYTDGKCACGAEDPDYTPEQPPVEEPEEEPKEEPNFFEKIIAWIVEFFNKLFAMFKKN